MSMHSSRRPALAPLSECVDIKAAALIAEVDIKTMRRWHQRYGLGRKRVGAHNAPIIFSLVELSAFMHGDEEALAQLRAGNYQHATIQAHRLLLGLVSP